jgi:hypothetical protein
MKNILLFLFKTICLFLFVYLVPLAPIYYKNMQTQDKLFSNDFSDKYKARFLKHRKIIKNSKLNSIIYKNSKKKDFGKFINRKISWINPEKKYNKSLHYITTSNYSPKMKIDNYTLTQLKNINLLNWPAKYKNVNLKKVHFKWLKYLKNYDHWNINTNSSSNNIYKLDYDRKPNYVFFEVWTKLILIKTLKDVNRYIKKYKISSKYGQKKRQRLGIQVSFDKISWAQNCIFNLSRLLFSVEDIKANKMGVKLIKYFMSFIHMLPVINASEFLKDLQVEKIYIIEQYLNNSNNLFHFYSLQSNFDFFEKHAFKIPYICTIVRESYKYEILNAGFLQNTYPLRFEKIDYHLKSTFKFCNLKKIRLQWKHIRENKPDSYLKDLYKTNFKHADYTSDYWWYMFNFNNVLKKFVGLSFIEKTQVPFYNVR